MASPAGRRFHRARMSPAASRSASFAQNSGDSRTPPRDCRPLQYDIWPSSECHQSDEPQRLQISSPGTTERNQPTVLERFAPFPSNEVERAQRSQVRSEHLHRAARHAAQSCDANFGNRLRIAGSDFAGMAEISRELPREAYSLHQLVGRRVVSLLIYPV